MLWSLARDPLVFNLRWDSPTQYGASILDIVEIGIPALAKYFMTDNRVVYLVLERDDETYERSNTLKWVL